MLTLLDFQAENQNFVIITPTISMCQNCSISVLVDPGGAKKQFENLAHPWYDYDMQSIQPLVNAKGSADWKLSVVEVVLARGANPANILRDSKRLPFK